MNVKRLRIIVFTVIAILAIGLTAYGIYSLISRSQQQADLVKVKTFSENFIRDYSTYQSSSSVEYNKRISNYILPAYKKSFLEKYELGPVKSLDQIDLNNYSKYISSEINITPMSEANTYDVVISYNTKIFDASASSSPSTENNKIELTVTKNEDQYYITTFGYTE